MTKNPKHQNQIRIIGGTHRGRKINFNDAEGLRPTPDSVRERLFNWLGQDLTGKTVLDLFAGSGALGFEASSRGAKETMLIELNRQTAQNLRHQAQLLSLNNQLIIQTTSALTFLQTSTQQFDVVFLDPPFAWQEWQNLFQTLTCRLKEEALIYIEAAKLPEIPTQFEIYREGRAGQSKFALLKFQNITLYKDNS